MEDIGQWWTLGVEITKDIESYDMIEVGRPEKTSAYETPWGHSYVHYLTVGKRGELYRRQFK